MALTVLQDRLDHYPEHAAIKQALAGSSLGLLLDEARSAMPAKPGPGAIQARERLLAQRFISIASLEAWLGEVSPALGDMIFDMTPQTLLALAGAQVTRSIHPMRIAGPETTRYVQQASVSLAGFTATLLWLESLGFDCRSRPFLDKVRADLKNVVEFSPEEFICLQHRTGFKGDRPVVYLVNPDAPAGETRRETLKMFNSVTLEAITTGEGEEEVVCSILARRGKRLAW